MKRKMALLLAGLMGTSAVLGMGGCGNKGTEELVKKEAVSYTHLDVYKRQVPPTPLHWRTPTTAYALRTVRV